MKWWPLLVLGVLLVVAVGVQADDNSHRTFGDCNASSDAGSRMAPTVVAVHVDEERMIAARQDGYVQAIDRVNGNVLWTYPSDYLPAEPVRDMIADDERVYVAYADTENNAADQVIALDIDSGEDLWRSIDWGNGRDAFRLAQDDSFVFVGLDRGGIAKLSKFSGEAFELATGSVVMFRPTLHAESPDPNGIYAMTVVGDRLIAARNFGNLTADQAVELSHENNTLIILNKNSLQPFGGVPLEAGEAPGEFILRDDNGPRPWGVFGIWADGSTDEVFLSGSEVAFWFQDPSGQQIFGDRVRFGKIPLSDGGAQLTADATTDMGQVPLGPPIISGTQVTGVAGGPVIAVTTTTTQSPGGYILELDRGDLGASLAGIGDNGDIRGIAIDPDDADRIVHGHQCVVAGGKQAGLIRESRTDERGTVTLLSPTGQEANQGTLDVALRVQAANVGDPHIQFLVSSVAGRCADGQSCYTPLEELGGTPPFRIPIGNGDITIEDVEIPLPEGSEYRLQVRLLSGSQPRSEDLGEGTFTIDRTAPEILGVSPPDGGTIAGRQPVLDVIVRDSGSPINRGATQIVINGEAFDDLAFDANGFSLDLSETTDRLREGFNDLSVVVRDRAGNTARLAQWEIIVDSAVDPPVFLPETGTWVRDERPTMTVEFREHVTLTKAHLNGDDVTDTVAVPPTDPGDGTRLIFRPEGTLSTGLVHRFDVWVRDDAGNEAGPFSRVFRVDATPPTIGQLNPSPGQLLNDPVPSIIFQPADSGSGLDTSTLGFFLDGEDVTDEVLALADRFAYIPSPLSHGEHEATVSVMDQAGNRATRSWSFTTDLTTPVVDVDVQLPAGQTAVKRGDEVTFRVHVTDDARIRAVRLDARGLDVNATTAERLAEVPGLPGAFEKTLQVTAVNTQEVLVTITAEDATGQIGFKEITVLVDNAPPVARMLDLPAIVGASFDVRWDNEPNDARVGGSGVAYYILERRIDDGQWRVVMPRVEKEQVEMELIDSPFARLQFRVRAVDNAGNEQLAPSNVVETVARGDPFIDTRFPDTIAIGQDATYSARPLDEVDLGGSQVFLRFTSSDGSSQDINLGRYGRLYTTDWNATALDAGTYNLQFVFRDGTGIELKGPSYTVQAVKGGSEETLSSGSDAEARGIPAPWWLALPALWYARRRSA